MALPVAEVISAEIRRRGPIPFADYMALALGHPDVGYYTAATARPTRTGDFLTAPELHPIFGAALARQAHEAWERVGRPLPFTLLEYGAGSGTLALAILDGLRADGSPLAGAIAYAPVELSRHRLAELAVRAAEARLPLLDPGTLDDAPTSGIVLANEYLDACPCTSGDPRRRRARDHGRPGRRRGFVEARAEIADPVLAGTVEAIRAAGRGSSRGSGGGPAAVEAWAREVGRRLATGLVLVLDYGAPAPTCSGRGTGPAR